MDDPTRQDLRALEDRICWDADTVSGWTAWHRTKHGPDRCGWEVHATREDPKTGTRVMSAIRNVDTGEVRRVAGHWDGVGSVDPETAARLLRTDRWRVWGVRVEADRTVVLIHRVSSFETVRVELSPARGMGGVRTEGST